MKKKFRNFAAIALGVVLTAALMNACNEPALNVDPAAKGVGAAPLPLDSIGGVNECTTTNLTTRTLTNDRIWKLKGDVRVPNGVTLTIDAGTIIKGDPATVGTLTVERGGKIIAIGTPSSPIVFTSFAPAGSRNPQDWGGVNIFGKAPNNQSVNAVPEGYPVCLTAPQHGGTQCDDNSGQMSYVRIEYGGKKTGTADIEKNGLTLYSVGSGTILDHIQVSYGGDDAFEWFGGCVNATYLFSYANKDDDFDTDWGYSGAVQYAIAIRDPQLADDSKSNGFESDTDADGVNGTRTTAVFSNVTLVGPYDPNATRTVVNTPGVAEFGDGLHLRRNTGIDIYNTVVAGWKRGLYLDDSSPAKLVTASILGYNTIGVPYYTSGVTFSCVYEPVTPNNAWTAGVSNVCRTATAQNANANDNNGLIRQSGLTSLAWTASDVTPKANAGAPFAYTSPLLGTGVQASTVDARFGFNVTNSTSAGYFEGARRITDDNGWNFSTSGSSWVNLDPQNTPYN